METWRFCLETIHEEAFACGHCGHWQPTRQEINSAYREVMRTLVKEERASKGSALSRIIGVGLFSFFALLYLEVAPPFILISSLFFVWLYYKIVRIYKTKVVLKMLFSSKSVFKIS